MKPRTTVAVMSIALAGILLTGCTPSLPVSAATHSPRNSATQIPVPQPAPTLDTQPLDRQIDKNIFVEIYNAGSYTSSVDCGCSLDYAGTHVAEVYPRGTTVWMLRVSLRGVWGLNQVGTTRDVTGTTVAGQFEGRPEAAVVDTKEGPAHTGGQPWLFSGLFPKGTKASLENDRPQSFLLAFHVPPGSRVLDLTVNIPIEPEATKLHLTLPAAVVAAANNTQGANE